MMWRFRFLILAVCVTLAAGIIMNAVRPADHITTPTVTLVTDVPAGTELAEHHMATVDSMGALPRDAIVTSDEALGRRTLIDLSEGTSVAESLLVPEGSQFALNGRHAIPVPLANAELRHLYPPGTQVRVVMSPDTHGINPTDAPRHPVVVDDAVVLPPTHHALGDSEEGSVLGLPSGGGPSLGQQYLLLGVSPADAILISSIGPTAPLSVIIVE